MPWIFKTNKNRALKHPTFPNHESCDQMQTPVVYLIKIKPSFPFPFFSFSSSTPSNACGKIHHLEAGFLWDLTKIIQESIFCQKLSDKSSGLHIITPFLLCLLFHPPSSFHWDFELLTAEQMRYAHEVWRLHFCTLLCSLPQLHFAWFLNNSRSTEKPLCLYVQNTQLSTEFLEVSLLFDKVGHSGSGRTKWTCLIE